MTKKTNTTPEERRVKRAKSDLRCALRALGLLDRLEEYAGEEHTDPLDARALLDDLAAAVAVRS